MVYIYSAYDEGQRGLDAIDQLSHHLLNWHSFLCIL